MAILREMLQSFFSPTLMSSAYPHLFRLLWHSNLPCSPSSTSNSSLLTRCSWAGAPINCSDIFRPVTTDSGVCCAFNAESVLRDSSFTDLVKEMGGGGEAEIRNALVGKMKGLSIMMDQHTDEISFGTLMSDTSGFDVFIGEPGEFPLMRQRSFKISPGQEHFVKLSPTSFTAEDGLRSVNPEDRGCLFKEESSLKFHSQYSYTSCVFECKISLALAATRCIPWFMPQEPNSTACGPWEAQQFTKVMDSVDESTSCASCQPDCKTTGYTFTQTPTPFR